MLSSEEEFMLAKAWVDHDDRKSAHRLVTSHLRLLQKLHLVIEAMAYQSTKLFQRQMLV